MSDFDIEAILDNTLREEAFYSKLVKFSLGEEDKIEFEDDNEI